MPLCSSKRLKQYADMSIPRTTTDVQHDMSLYLSTSQSGVRAPPTRDLSMSQLCMSTEGRLGACSHDVPGLWGGRLPNGSNGCRQKDRWSERPGEWYCFARKVGWWRFEHCRRCQHVVTPESPAWEPAGLKQASHSGGQKRPAAITTALRVAIGSWVSGGMWA